MSIDGGAYVDGDVRTFDKLPLDTKNFTVTVKITVDEKRRNLCSECNSS